MSMTGIGLNEEPCKSNNSLFAFTTISTFLKNSFMLFFGFLSNFFQNVFL